MNERRIGILIPTITREPDNGFSGGNTVRNPSAERVEEYTQVTTSDPLAGMNTIQQQLALKLSELGIKPENARHVHKLNPDHTGVGF